MTKLVERYGCMIDLPGVGYSGRLPLLLHSGRPVLLVENEWSTWVTQVAGSEAAGKGTGTGLEPWRSYIPVKSNLEDLVEKAKWVKDHPERARAIGLEGQRVAQTRLTHRAAVEAMAAELRRLSQLGLGPGRSRRS